MAKKRTKKSAASVAGTVIRHVVKRNPKVVSALGLGGDGLTTIGLPAGGTFIAARLLSYLAQKLAKGDGKVAVAKWRKALAPHAPVLVHLFLLALIAYGRTKSKLVAKYSTGAFIGVGVSALLTIVQSYILKPKALPAAKPSDKFANPWPEDTALEGVEDEEMQEQPLEGDPTSMSDDELQSFRTGVFA